MDSYNKPNIILLPDPRGIDKAIQAIQLKLTNLSWLDTVFGRAFLQKEKVAVNEAEAQAQGAQNRQREIVYPECFGKNMEPINVMPNDNRKGVLFFYKRDPSEYPDYDSFSDQVFTVQSITIIAWVNLKKVDPSKDFRYFSALIEDLHNILLRTPGLKIERSFEQFDKVFSDFTLTETYRQYQKWPYAAIKIEATLSFAILPENC